MINFDSFGEIHRKSNVSDEGCINDSNFFIIFYFQILAQLKTANLLFYLNKKINLARISIQNKVKVWSKKN